MDSDTIVVTGMGAVSSLGIGCEAMWDAIEHGRDGIREVTRFSTEDYRVHIAGVVPGYEERVDPEDQAALDALCLRFGVLAAQEALEAARGATELASLLGYGLASDAHHETTPDPNGAGVARAVGAALEDAGIDAAAIGYANLHGTGTAANDPAEWRGYRRVFAERADALPVSATKGYLGHAQGAAGVLELIVTLLAMRRGVVPPTLHLSAMRRGAPEDPVASDAPRAHPFDAAVKTSSAFGGANAALVVGRAGMAQANGHGRRDVWLLGSAAVGLDAKSTMEDLAAVLPRANPRAMDGAGRLLTMVSALALRDAGVEVRGTLRERTGLVAAITRPPADADAEFQKSVRQRGLARLSASAFARLVLVSPAGACCHQLSLKGPLSTLTTGAGSDLVALAYAAELLAGHDDADLMLAGGVFEGGGEDGVSRPRDGAVAVLLGAGESVPGHTIRVAGWSVGAPDSALEVSRAAMHRAGVEVAERFEASECEALAEGAGWAGACARATEALRAGVVDAALLCSAQGRSASVAVLLTREGSDG